MYITPEYGQSLAPYLPELYKNGESIAEVCSTLGVTIYAYRRLREICPKFQAAHELGMLAAQAHWDRLGRKGASMEARIQPQVWALVMKNRFDYSEQNTVDVKDPNKNVPLSEYAKARAAMLDDDDI
jgi:hypothetical protein